jgi:glutamate dehydrogenase/leucine dehydrogenase
MAPEAFDREFDHEQLTVFQDSATGVIGVIAVHSTALGPAMGGLRLFGYSDLSAAIVDVLRLARAMSFKSAAAGLHLGGGKAVLLDDGRWNDHREERMRAVGTMIESLDGRYITAEDVGTTPSDMDSIAEVTRHVAGGSSAQGGSGDPSPFTARTVFASIEAAARIRLGRDLRAGLRVGVQGVGHVGASLAGLLTTAGAEVFVTDVNVRRSEEVAAEIGATALPIADFAFGDFDVFAPCALGGMIGLEEVERLRAPIVSGAANNPLAHRDVATALAAKKILYVPDFIANCGGIIHVGAEALGLSAQEADDLLEAAGSRTEEVLAEARWAGLLPLELAERQALNRINARREAAL